MDSTRAARLSRSRAGDVARVTDEDELDARGEGETTRAWSVPLAVNDVPEAGLHLDLVADGGHARPQRLPGSRPAALRGQFRRDASRARRLARCRARSATVGQTCVVTLEPIENEIEEPFDLFFVPAARPPRRRVSRRTKSRRGARAAHRGMIDLGAIATEFLILGIDPYPRKPGAVFQPPAAGEEAAHPFAALAL